MGDGVTAPISGYRSVRLYYYIIFIRPSCSFPLNLWLVCSSFLMPNPDAFLFPPVYDIWGSWPPLLCHRNDKNRPCRNVLGHTVVTVGNILPNHTHIHVHQHLTKWGGGEGGTPIVRSGTKSSGKKSISLPNYTGSPTPPECGPLWPTTPIWKVWKTGPPPPRTSQRSWCQTPLTPTVRITFPISLALHGGYWHWQATHCHQNKAPDQGIWMYPTSLGSDRDPGTLFLWLLRCHRRQDCGYFALPLSCIFFFQGVLSSMFLGYNHITLLATVVGEVVQPNTSPFSTHHIIWVNYKVLSQLYQLISLLL